MPIATPGRQPAFWGRGRKPHFEQRKVQVKVVGPTCTGCCGKL